MRNFALAACAAFALFYASCLAARAEPPGTPLSELSIPGTPDHGIFDPSIATAGGSKLYMALSGVSSTVPGGGFKTLAVRTYLAASTDRGKSWNLAGILNPDVEVQLGRAPYRGRWQSEVPALAYDPQAPKEARWKLAWHQYLAVDGDRKFEHGWIAYKEAATPEQLAATRPVKLFIGTAYDTVNDAASGWTRPPVTGPGLNMVDKLSPALKSCIVLSEPSLLAKPEALYMAMFCYKPKLLGLLGAANYGFMLKCARPCNPAAPGAWSYVATLVTPDDAEALGQAKFSGADLFSAGGRDYLTLSPVGDKPVKDAYNGCTVFRFADLAQGKLERGADGRLAPVTAISAGKDSFNGACSMLPGAGGGLLIGRVEFSFKGTPDAVFHVFRTSAAP